MLFLQECSMFLSPVNCDVINGSIAVKLQGTDQQLQNVTTFLKQNGMELPSFPKFNVKETSQSLAPTPNSNSLIETISAKGSSATSPFTYLAVILMIFCIIGIIVYTIAENSRTHMSTKYDKKYTQMCNMSEIDPKRFEAVKSATSCECSQKYTETSEHLRPNTTVGTRL